MDNPNNSHSYVTGANAIALPIFATLSLLINYIPFLLLHRVHNLAGCTLILTIALTNLITLINSLLWPNNNWNTWYNGAGLCDIEVQIKVPIYTLTATSLCSITRSLARALDTDNATLHESRGVERRKTMWDVAFCFGIPFLQLALHYVVSNARFGISPVYGCLNPFDLSWPTVVIMFIWSPLFGILNCCYALAVIHRLRKHRSAFASTLSTSGSGLSPRRFIKLFLMSFVLLLIYLPLTIYYFYVDIPRHFYIYSFSTIHDPKAWLPIQYYHTWDNVASQYDGWAGIGTSAAIFLFFGLNNEAVDIYRAASVRVGAGRIWPSLKKPRRQQQSGSRRGSAASTASWKSHFDVVGKAMHYFENVGGNRKDSGGSGGSRKSSGGATSLSFGKRISNAIQSRKSSQATSDQIPLSTRSSPRESISNSISTSSNNTTAPTTTTDTILTDVITHAPTPDHLLTPIPTALSAPIPHRGIGLLSTFCTHINLPPLTFISHQYSSTTSSTASSLPAHLKPPTQKGQDLDIEAQQFNSSRDFVHPATTVSTTIWSSGPTPVGTPPPPPITSLRSGNGGNGGEDVGDGEGKGEPKMGSRERREMNWREFEMEKGWSVSPVSALSFDAEEVMEKRGVIVEKRIERVEGGV